MACEVKIAKKRGKTKTCLHQGNGRHIHIKVRHEVKKTTLDAPLMSAKHCLVVLT